MLPDFITRSEELADMDGNVGRKLTRHIEQLFPNGLFAATFECVCAEDLVDQALYAQRMQNAADMAAARTAYREFAPGFTLSVETSEPGVALVVVAPLAFPEALREKKALLTAFADAMRVFVAMHIGTTPEGFRRMRREQLEDLAFEPQDVQYRYLAELVSGNYANLAATAGNFVALAAVLNPAVDDQMRKLMAEDLAAELAH